MPTTEINGVETYYERHGKGRPVVFVHGLTFDHRTWRPQIEPLADDYEVITYDYRGHGKTEGEDITGISVHTLVDDLRGLLEELEVDEPPVLCGHSYGGLIIAEYARQYPENVAGLVFAEARTNIGEKTHERAFIRLQPVFATLDSIVGEARMKKVREAIVKWLEDAEIGDHPYVEELGMTSQEYMEEASEQVPRERMAAFLRAGLEYEGVTPAEFDVPVLFSYGELGVNMIGGKADELEQEEGVTVQEIAEADHMISLQKPETFNRSLREFLANIQGEPASADRHSSE